MCACEREGGGGGGIQSYMREATNHTGRLRSHRFAYDEYKYVYIFLTVMLQEC